MLQCRNSAGIVSHRGPSFPVGVVRCASRGSLVGRLSCGSCSKVASPDSQPRQSCRVEACRASLDLLSDACWVGSRRSMSCGRRIRVSFATVHYPGDGMSGQSTSHAGENLIMV
jgi:hypothetical protein